jgi:hypothetical protein
VLYFSGVLEGGTEEFETADDIYEAIGCMLIELAEGKGEKEIREICDRLHHVLKE